MKLITKTLLLAIIASLSAISIFAAVENRKIDIDTTEGTWMSLDVSPDGKQIVFDLLGDIYLIPVSGGEAKRLTTLPRQVLSRTSDDELPNKGQSFESQPRFSPDGKSIVFISDRDGSDNIYTMNADGSGLRQVTTGRNGFISPAWSPDGKFIAVRRKPIGPGPAGASGGLWIYSLDSGEGTSLDVGKLQVVNGVEFSRDGNVIFFAAPVSDRSDIHQILQYDRRTRKTVQFTQNFGGAVRPRISPDGKWMAYATFDDGETVLRMRELATGRERKVLRGIEHDIQLRVSGQLDVLPNYGFSPDGQFIYLSYLGKIHRVSVPDGKTAEVPFHVKTTLDVGPKLHLHEKPLEGMIPVRMLQWTQFTPDNRLLLFEALGKIWVADAKGGQPRRLTSATIREYEPSISPDGQWVAYVTWSDTKRGQVCKVSIHGGEPVILTREPGYYVNPNWSADGQRLVVEVGAGSELHGDDPTRDLTRTLSLLPAEGGELQPITVLAIPPTNQGNMHFQGALDIGGHFNLDGTRVRYMQGPELHSIRLDGSDDKISLKLSVQCAEMQGVPCLVAFSPDEKHVAFTGGNNQVWMMPMPESTGETVVADIKSKSLPAGLKRVSTIGGYYPSWLGNDELSWTFGGNVYRYKVNSAEKPETVVVDLKAQVPAPSGTVVLQGARLITMKGDQVIPNGAIVIKDNRIAEIGPVGQVHIPSGAKILDVSGKTIIPGLLDIHDHILTGNMIRIVPEQDRFPAAVLAYGITTFRDPSAPNIGAFYTAELINTGQMRGPRAYSTGEALVPSTVEVHNLQEAIDMVTLQKDLGAIMLKQYTQPTRRQRELVQEAARQVGIMSTAEGGVDYKYNLGMLLDGYIGTEHLWALHPLYGDIGQLMAKTGYFYTPTLGTSAAGSEHWFRRMDVDHDPKQQHFLLHTWREHLWRRILQQKIQPEWETAYLDSIQSVNRMLDAGARVAMGSHDEPTPTGLGSHWELWSYVEGGMTPMQALRCGTLTAADALGMAQDLGSLEKGKLADLVILNANPLEKIQNTIKIDRVMENGFLYDGNTLDEVWPKSQKFRLWGLRNSKRGETRMRVMRV